MTNNEVLHHWRYFLTLEKDLINTQNYIEIHEDNFKAFSFEFSKILQLTCAEIDSICRIICKLIDNNNTFSDDTVYGGNITQYKKIILKKYPSIIETKINMSAFNMSCNPWEDWKKSNSPDWWSDYNKLKHYRHNNFSNANLENVCLSLSGLMVLNLYLNRIVNDTPFSQPLLETSFFKCNYMSSGSFLRPRPNNPLPDFEDDFKKIKK